MGRAWGFEASFGQFPHFLVRLRSTDLKGVTGVLKQTVRKLEQGALRQERAGNMRSDGWMLPMLSRSPSPRKVGGQWSCEHFLFPQPPENCCCTATRAEPQFVGLRFPVVEPPVARQLTPEHDAVCRLPFM